VLAVENGTGTESGEKGEGGRNSLRREEGERWQTGGNVGYVLGRGSEGWEGEGIDRVRGSGCG